MWWLGSWEKGAASFGFFACCGRELEIPVWIILNDYDIVLAANSVEILAALDGKCSTGRILSNSAIVVS